MSTKENSVHLASVTGRPLSVPSHMQLQSYFSMYDDAWNRV